MVFLANYALKNDTLKNYTAHPGTNLTNILSLKHPAWTNVVGPKSWGGRHILLSNHQNKTLRKDHKRFLTGSFQIREDSH
jgi:hypothetical protein